MHKFTGPLSTPLIGDDVAYVMPGDEWDDFRYAATKPNNTIAFTGKALNDYVGSGVIMHSPAYRQVRPEIAELIGSGHDFTYAPKDIVIPISAADRHAMIIDPSRAKSIKKRYLEEAIDQAGLTGVVKAEKELPEVEVFDDHQEGDIVQLFVWTPPGDLVSGKRPRVRIAEVIVDGEGVHGDVLESTRHGSERVLVDPNLALLANATTHTTYDRTLGARVTTVNVHVTAPGIVSKAETPERRRAAVSHETRNEHGRWVHLVDGKPFDQWIREQSEAKPAPLTPVVRRHRQPRRGALQNQDLARGALAPIPLTRNPLSRMELERAKLRTTETKGITIDWDDDRVLPVFDNGEYSIVDPHELKHKLGIAAGTQDRVLDGDQTSWLRYVAPKSWGINLTGDIIGRADALPAQVLDWKEANYSYDDEGLANLQRDVAKMLKPSTIIDLQLWPTMNTAGVQVMRVRLTPRRLRHQDSINVIYWNNTTPEYNHEISWKGSKQFQSPDEVDMDVAREWEYSLRQPSDEASPARKPIYNPKLDFWVVNDADPSR